MYIYHYHLWIVIWLISSEHAAIARKNNLQGTKWWTLAQVYDTPKSHSETNPSNPRMQHLTKKQRKIVERNPESIFAVAKGASIAIKECQYQFQRRKWNCPTKEDYNLGGSMFGKILNVGCPETAFIYSITSAGVAHSIATACSEGRIHTCSCSYHQEQPDKGQGWEWGGCSDNVKFGYRFSKNFIDPVELGEDIRFMVNKQNNEAGRRHVASETTRQCKCHGMSGSCIMKTCWMRLPTFRTVGDILKGRFDGASKVLSGNNWDSSDNRISSNSNRPSRSSSSRSGSSNNMVNSDKDNKENRAKKEKRKRYNFVPVHDSHKTPTRKDLVYFEESPDFCSSESKSKYNFGGTTGRECNETAGAVDECDLMCCNKGHLTEKYTANVRCKCEFKWCCEVKCQTCSEERVRHICN